MSKPEQPHGGQPYGYPGRVSMALFSFLYLKKIKISKIYARFEIFQKYPPVAHIGRQALSVLFSSNLQRGPWKKRGPSPLHGRQGGLSPPLGRPLGPAHGRGRGACRPPPRATGVSPYISSNPPLPSSFEPENSTKNLDKKRGVRRRKAAKPCRIQHL